MPCPFVYVLTQAGSDPCKRMPAEKPCLSPSCVLLCNARSLWAHALCGKRMWRRSVGRVVALWCPWRCHSTLWLLRQLVASANQTFVVWVGVAWHLRITYAVPLSASML